MAYPMTKHMAAEHAGVGDSEKTFSTRIFGSHISGNLTRFLSEAVAISEEQAKGTQMLNSKGEWARAKLRRLAVVAD